MASSILRLQRRLMREESGFTLIELLMVLMIIGILLAIAVPSYLGFKDRANRGAAEANVRSAVPAVEAYYSDNGTYTGMDGTALAAIDAGVKVTIVSVGASTYCISNTQGTYTAYKNGPTGSISAVACT
jgi:type IV pilus assembly protein PilA